MFQLKYVRKDIIYAMEMDLSLKLSLVLEHG